MIPATIATAALAAACSVGGGDRPNGTASPAEPTVFVQDYWGRGVHGLWVASHDSAGGLVAEKQTGGNGAAHLALAGTGGSVTLYVPLGEELLVETVLRAGAGPIRFIVSPIDPPPEDLPAPTQFHLSISVPPDAARVTADLGCSAVSSESPPSGGVIEVDLTDEPCTYVETEAIFLTARSGPTNTEVAWGLVTGVTEDPGSTVPISAAALDTRYLDWTVTAILPPGPDVTESSISGVFTSDYVGQRISTPVASVTSGALHAWTSRLPDAPFSSWITYAGASYGSSQLAAFALSMTGGDPAFSFDGLPMVSVAPVDPTPVDRPVIRWDAPESSDANVVIAGAYWMRTSGASTYFFASSPGSVPLAEVRLPQMPERFAAWNAGEIASTHVTFVEYRRSSLVHSPADIAADYYRGMGGIAPEGYMTFLSAQSIAP